MLDALDRALHVRRPIDGEGLIQHSGRTGTFAVADPHERAMRRVAKAFPKRLADAVPYRIHTVLNDHGTAFTSPGNEASPTPDIRLALERGALFRARALLDARGGG